MSSRLRTRVVRLDGDNEANVSGFNNIAANALKFILKKRKAAEVGHDEGAGEQGAARPGPDKGHNERAVSQAGDQAGNPASNQACNQADSQTGNQAGNQADNQADDQASQAVAKVTRARPQSRQCWS